MTLEKLCIRVSWLKLNAICREKCGLKEPQISIKNSVVFSNCFLKSKNYQPLCYRLRRKSLSYKNKSKTDKPQNNFMKKELVNYSLNVNNLQLIKSKIKDINKS